MPQIRFFLDQYYLFSNYSAIPVTYKGYTYPTSEHAYQTTKFANHLDISEKIKHASSPSVAKKLSLHYEVKKRKDWDNIKLQIMTDIIHHKAQQHKEIQKKLLATGNDEIIENSMDDYFWGCGKDGSGQNKMGKIWMQIRNELKV